MSQHDSTTPIESRDLWATPDWLFKWLDSRYRFGVDLAADSDNSKCVNFFSQEHDSLAVDWHFYKTGFLNPPYSKIAPWIEKASIEATLGFTTVMVIPTPNGESYYSRIFERASEIIFINGRISFLAAQDYTKKGKQIKKGDAIGGNTRGTCVVVFAPKLVEGCIKISHVDRDDVIEVYG